MGTCCVYNDTEDTIDPGDEAIIRCKWTGPIPPRPFFIEGLDYTTDLLASSPIDVMPGIGDIAEQGRETLLCIKNMSPLPVALEAGQVLALGKDMPPDLVLVRRDVDPESQREIDTESNE